MDNFNDIDLEVLPIKIDDSDVVPLNKPVHPTLMDIQDGSVLLIIGKRGTSKTTIFSNLIMNPNMLGMENFDYGFIISPTAQQDKTISKLVDKYKATTYTNADNIDNILKDIIAFQKSFGEKSQIPRSFIFLDDCLGKIKRNSISNYLTSRSRHLLQGGMLCITTQNMKSIPTCCRTNSTHVIIGRTTNQKEFQSIFDEFGSVFGNYDEFKKACNYCWKDKYNFMYMNFTHPEGKKVFKNFTEDITDKFFPQVNNYSVPEENENIDLNNDIEEN